MTADESRLEMVEQHQSFESEGKRPHNGVYNPIWLNGHRDPAGRRSQAAVGSGFLPIDFILSERKFRELLVEGGGVLNMFPNRGAARSRELPIRFPIKVELRTVSKFRLCF